MLTSRFLCVSVASLYIFHVNFAKFAGGAGMFGCGFSLASFPASGIGGLRWRRGAFMCCGHYTSTPCAASMGISSVCCPRILEKTAAILLFPDRVGGH